MKRIVAIILFLGLVIAAFAQLPKRYVYVEHFTNTRCSICGTHNPGLFQRLNDNPGEVHHISIHSEVPYPACNFYQANTVGNNTRKDYYGDVFGTPTSYTNGTIKAQSGGILPQSRIDNLAGRTGPLQVKVSELISGGTLFTTINVKTYDVVSQTDLKLYAAVVERMVNYMAPNGEDVHYNVFREMLPQDGGVAFTPATIGDEVTLNYQLAIDPSWDASEVGVVVFIQSDATKEVLNSGTALDIVLEPEVIDEDCASANNGMIRPQVSGGTPPFTYAWNTGASSENLMNVEAGTYTLTVTDAANFEYIQEYEVTINNTLAASLTYTPTASTTGTASASPSGGTVPYTYNWSNGDTDSMAINLPTGPVTVTVTDANGCTIQESITVQSIGVQSSTGNISCAGASDGNITVAVQGGMAPFTYNWNTGAMDDNVTNLSPGAYTVTITDADMVTLTESFTLTEPDSLKASVTTTATATITGTATVSINGGTLPYTYTWNTGGATVAISGLSAGTYTLTIVDANNCSIQREAIIEQEQLTSIAEELAASFQIYPNPVEDVLTLSFFSVEERKVSVYSLLGQLSIDLTVTSLKQELDVSQLNTGLYFLQVEEHGVNYQQRIIVN